MKVKYNLHIFCSFINQFYFCIEDIRALDGGPEGMNVIRNILKVAANNLKPEGSLWLEVDSRHPEIIKKITENFYDEWKLKFISSYQDIFKKDRFVEIEKEIEAPKTE